MMNYVNVNPSNKYLVYCTTRVKGYGIYTMHLTFKEGERSYFKKFVFDVNCISLYFENIDEDDSLFFPMCLKRFLMELIISSRRFDYEALPIMLDELLSERDFFKEIKFDFDALYYMYVMIRDYLSLFKTVYISERCLNCSTIGYESTHFLEKK